MIPFTIHLIPGLIQYFKYQSFIIVLKIVSQLLPKSHEALDLTSLGFTRQVHQRVIMVHIENNFQIGSQKFINDFLYLNQKFRFYIIRSLIHTPRISLRIIIPTDRETYMFKAFFFYLFNICITPRIVGLLFKSGTDVNTTT